MSPALPPVTVCLPAYQSEEFLSATLDCVCDQTFPDLTIRISIDPSKDKTEALCLARAAEDDRIEIHVQPKRLGWLGNLNWLFDRVQTDWFFFMPHDDQIALDYVASLYEASIDHPQAVNVFADIEQVGLLESTLRSKALDGPLVERVLAFLSEELSAHPFRGLTRRGVLDAGVRLRDNAFDGFAADVAFVLEVLCLGPFHHVPRALFQRNERPNSVVRSWENRPKDWRLASLAEHIAVCLRILATASESPEERAVLVNAGLLRLLRQYWLGYTHYSDSVESHQDPWALLTGVASRLLDQPPILGTAFDRLQGEPLLDQALAELDYQEALVRIQQSDWFGAKTHLERTVQLNPANSEAHRQHGIALDHLGRQEESLAAFQSAAQAAPDDLGALTALIDALARRNASAEAEPLARRAAQLFPEDPNAQFQLSHILVLRDDISGAHASAQRAVDLNPDQPEYAAHLRRLETILSNRRR